jgi:tight adherence protein B
MERFAARLLDQAAIEMSVLHAVQLWGAAALGAAVFVSAVGGPALGLVAVAVVVGGGPFGLWANRGRRSRLIAAAVPVAVETVASELRVGGTVVTALGSLTRDEGVLASDFARVDARVQLGASVTDALDAWATERPAPGVDAAAGALAMCAAVGGRAADALDGLASSLRDRLAVMAEARALSAQARLSAIVVGGMPLLFLGWSAVADRRAIGALFESSAGRACLAVGVALEAVGVWWMRRILRSAAIQ